MSGRPRSQIDPRALLDELLDGMAAPSPDLVGRLIQARVGEGLCLEYKRGDWLTGSGASARLRQYIAGFANSEGGVLVVGVAGADGASPGRPPWVWDPIVWKKSQPLDSWVTNATNPLAGMFDRVPRWWVVEVDAGEVLIVATRRSQQLVAVREGSAPAYYVRMGDSTLRAPDYLVRDLLFGRRERPCLDIHLVEALEIESRDSEIALYGLDEPIEMRWCKLEFSIDNDALAWAEGVFAGVVVADPFGMMPHPTRPVLDAIDVRGREPTEFRQVRVQLPDGRTDLEPMGTVFAHSDEIAVPWDHGLDWHVAVYVGARGLPPLWREFVVHGGHGSTVGPYGAGVDIRLEDRR